MAQTINVDTHAMVQTHAAALECWATVRKGREIVIVIVNVQAHWLVERTIALELDLAALMTVAGNLVGMKAKTVLQTMIVTQALLSVELTIFAGIPVMGHHHAAVYLVTVRKEKAIATMIEIVKALLYVEATTVSEVDLVSVMTAVAQHAAVT